MCVLFIFQPDSVPKVRVSVFLQFFSHQYLRFLVTCLLSYQDFHPQIQIVLLYLEINFGFLSLKTNFIYFYAISVF
jgi:hypothetical protein